LCEDKKVKSTSEIPARNFSGKKLCRPSCQMKRRQTLSFYGGVGQISVAAKSIGWHWPEIIPYQANY
jgi:hypothetical protein